jgi:hypothetical protein
MDVWLGLDNFSDAQRQCGHRKGLGVHLHAGIEVAVPDRRIFGVAGDKQHLQVRTGLTRGVGDLPSVDPPPRQADGS